MTERSLLEHVADIVSAHVRHNAVSVTDVADLIQSVHASLATLGGAVEADLVKPVPAVTVRWSVKPDLLTCLDCGAKMKMLKRHLKTEHGITPEQYRERWSLPSSYPMVAPDYAAKRRDIAAINGLGRRPRQNSEDQVSTAPAEPLASQ